MAGNVKVLVVDDNPMIRELLRQALAPLAQVTTAGDSADALLKAIDDPPDLVIADYTLPGTDGRQLFERLKGRAATAGASVILMASKADIQEKLRALEDRLEDFLEKPFLVKEAVARVKKIIDKLALEKMAREAPADGRLRGSLSQMNVVDLLQSLELGRKTCALTLSSNGERCQVFFTEGQINHAVYGHLRGDEAVFKVLCWPDGTFQIDFKGRSSERTTTRSTQGLLMEGLRLLDEANRDAAENVLEI
ncbi:MAG TPA: response regulator [Terriglobales bacterium]|nr:response regulator [Terriglobales bacterium]